MTRAALVAVVAEEDPARAAARLTSTGADLLELRLDWLARPEDGLALLRGAGRPVIATVRPTWAGGRFSGAEAGRLDLLGRAAAAGAAWIDVEAEARDRLPAGAARVLVSHHDFEGMPADLEERARRIGRPGDVVKLAATPATLAEAVALSRLAAPGVVPVAMGPHALTGRVLAARAGAPMVYGAAGAPVAPGQPLVEELRRFDLGTWTGLYGVLGHPVAHSIGPRVWNAVLAATGRSAVYLPFDEPDARDGLGVLERAGALGLSVTIPHKETAFAAAGRRSGDATRVGAANTLLRGERGGWRAENTDVTGPREVLRSFHGEASTRMTALVLGAGGAARAAVGALRDLWFEVLVSGRTPERARALEGRFVPWEERGAPRPDLVVNATPLGEVSPYPVERLEPHMSVFDFVYRPRVTRLLAAARERGCRTWDGLDLWVAQAEGQYRLWFGAAPPEGLFRRLAEEAAP
jgi:3-dehydroquinate dehydratase/shikimate dehydrogenase